VIEAIRSLIGDLRMYREITLLEDVVLVEVDRADGLVGWDRRYTDWGCT
jgi:hypothetical protein